MKVIILIFSLFILGCSSYDTPKEKPNNIPQELIGKWKIVEVYDSHGGNDPYWLPHETGAIYDYWFKESGDFLKNNGEIQGNYTVDKDNYIFFQSSNNQNSYTYFIENITIDSLIIDLLNFEPLKYKYIKISSESE